MCTRVQRIKSCSQNAEGRDEHPGQSGESNNSDGEYEGEEEGEEFDEMEETGAMYGSWK